ncbi:MAG: histidine kinase [Nostoc sp.]
MGNREDEGDKEELFNKFLPQYPMPNAQCPMPNAQCPMPNAQCPMTNDK